MANLAILFKQAEKHLPYTNIRQTNTYNILDLQNTKGYRIQGIAWQPIENQKLLQLYPPTKNRQILQDGSFLVAKNSKSECRYYDPDHKLEEVWSYVGCFDCSNLSSDMVWNWILQAHEYLIRDKNR